ncbi:ATP-binding protein [Streptomyces aureus]
MSRENFTTDTPRREELWGREAIRKRPGMYVGSVSERGLHQAVFDVVERAMNDALIGPGGHVDITLTADGGIRVTDDGPGVPVEAAGHSGGRGLEDVLTHLQDLKRRHPRGRHTVALSPLSNEPAVTNALSSRLTAEVRRDGRRWIQEYACGEATAQPTDAGAAAGSGTTITFWPDADIFETTTPSFERLTNHFREAAVLNPALTVSLADERVAGESRSVRFHFPDGREDLVAALGMETGARVHPDAISFAEEDERMAGSVEVWLRWCDSQEESVRSYANSMRTFEGGTHEAGFREGVTAAVDVYARGQRLLAADDPRPAYDRVGAGLTAVVSVKLDNPEFYGATRTRLGGDGDLAHPGIHDTGTVQTRVRDIVRAHVGTWLNHHPEQAESIVRRITDGTRRG